MKKTNEFDRTEGFLLKSKWLLEAERIEKRLGAKRALDYFYALCHYGLYSIEDDLQEPWDYHWEGIKEEIDNSQDSRAKHFSGENTEQTNEIIKYKTENPNASQRDIALATNTSLGKVNKVIQKYFNTDINSNSCSDSNIIVNVNTKNNETSDNKENTSSTAEEKTNKKFNYSEDIIDNVLDKFINSECKGKDRLTDISLLFGMDLSDVNLCLNIANAKKSSDPEQDILNNDYCKQKRTAINWLIENGYIKKISDEEKEIILKTKKENAKSDKEISDYIRNLGIVKNQNECIKTSNEQWGEEDNIISNLSNLDFDPQDPDFEDLY